MPVLDGLEETAMICVGGTRDVVVMVRRGSVGRLGAIRSRKLLYHVLYASEYGVRGKLLDAATFLG